MDQIIDREGGLVELLESARQNSAEDLIIAQKEIKADVLFIPENMEDGWFASRRLIFLNCVFSNWAALDDKLFPKGVILKDCIFERQLSLRCSGNLLLEGQNQFRSETTIKTYASLEIKDVAVLTSFAIEGFNSDSEVRLVEFNGKSVPIGSLTIKGLYGRLMLHTVNVSNIHFAKSTTSLLELWHLNIPGNFSFGGLDCPLKGEVFHSKFGKILFPEFLQQRFAKLNFEGCDIEELLIALDCCKAVTFNVCVIDHVTIGGTNEKDDALSFILIRIRHLAFLPLMNNIGNIHFQEVKMDESDILEIERCNLGRTSFILCKFSKAKFIFASSKMTEIFIADTDFPKLCYYRDQISHTQAQLAFGQISTAFQRQGDTVRALEYQSREIDAHYETLKFIDDDSMTFSFTKLSLWLNKWSNDFGRNWARGILFSFSFGLIFFYFLVLSSKEHYWGFYYDSRIISSYLKFMNPLRFFDTENLFKVNSDKAYLTLTPFSYLLDFFSRIIIAYGFYQTIQAFRRYGRRS